jgi:hypothetical protein
MLPPDRPPRATTGMPAEGTIHHSSRPYPPWVLSVEARYFPPAPFSHRYHHPPVTSALYRLCASSVTTDTTIRMRPSCCRPRALLRKQSARLVMRRTEAGGYSSHREDTTGDKLLWFTSGPATASPSTPPMCCSFLSRQPPSSATNPACHREPPRHPTTPPWRGSSGEHLPTLSPKMGSPCHRAALGPLTAPVPWQHKIPCSSI